jgi:hypothetical protein
MLIPLIDEVSARGPQRMSTHHTVRGTAGDDVLLVSQGGVFAFGGNDTIVATAGGAATT